MFVNDTLYVSTPFYRILAVEPDTGKLKWLFDPPCRLKALTQPDLKTRGVAYWQAAHRSRAAVPEDRLRRHHGAKLCAVDADTGKPAPASARTASSTSTSGTRSTKCPLSLLQPPTVYKNLLFIGWAGKDWAFAETPPGIVFALDAQTGALKWQFHPLTPEDGGTHRKGERLGEHVGRCRARLLYLPHQPAEPGRLWRRPEGGHSLRQRVIALNADTGEVVWSRQLVHHGLWDYDIISAPTLLDIEQDGQTIPALVQTTKQGFIFVLNRLTGEPVFPIEEPRSRNPTCRASRPRRHSRSRVRRAHRPANGRASLTLADIAQRRRCSRGRQDCATRAVTRRRACRAPRLSADYRRRGMGRRRARPAHQHVRRQQLQRRVIYRLSARGLRAAEEGTAGRRTSTRRRARPMACS